MSYESTCSDCGDPWVNPHVCTLNAKKLAHLREVAQTFSSYCVKTDMEWLINQIENAAEHLKLATEACAWWAGEGDPWSADDERWRELAALGPDKRTPEESEEVRDLCIRIMEYNNVEKLHAEIDRLRALMGELPEGFAPSDDATTELAVEVARLREENRLLEGDLTVALTVTEASISAEHELYKERNELARLAFHYAHSTRPGYDSAKLLEKLYKTANKYFEDFKDEKV